MIIAIYILIGIIISKLSDERDLRCYFLITVGWLPIFILGAILQISNFRNK